MSENELQQLREDMARMRRNLAQQLTETGDIVGAIRNIDEAFYDGKFLTESTDEDDDDYFEMSAVRAFFSIIFKGI